MGTLPKHKFPDASGKGLTLQRCPVLDSILQTAVLTLHEWIYCKSHHSETCLSQIITWKVPSLKHQNPTYFKTPSGSYFFTKNFSSSECFYLSILWTLSNMHATNKRLKYTWVHWNTFSHRHIFHQWLQSGHFERRLQYVIPSTEISGSLNCRSASSLTRSFDNFGSRLDSCFHGDHRNTVIQLQPSANGSHSLQERCVSARRRLKMRIPEYRLAQQRPKMLLTWEAPITLSSSSERLLLSHYCFITIIPKEPKKTFPAFSFQK